MQPLEGHLLLVLLLMPVAKVDQTADIVTPVLALQ